jgi:hemolysin III
MSDRAGESSVPFAPGLQHSQMAGSPGDRRPELVLDRWLHLAGLAGAPVAAAALIWSVRHAGGRVIAGVLVYCAGLLAMVGCSALYHLRTGSRHRPLFRRLDHAAIFLLIAGTYTPFALNAIGGVRGTGLLVFVWSVAACGVLLKLFRPAAIERASVALYLLLGWSVVAIADRLPSVVSAPTLSLLAAGGVLYTVGVVFHLWNSLRFQNAIWHGFVLAAAACHYAAVFLQSH